MEFLFVTKYLSGDIVGIIKELHIVFVAIVAVFVGMCLDFFFGIRKAKRNNVVRSSYGLRRTILKFIEYYSAMIIAFVLDLICSIAEPISMPYFTFACAGYIIYTEAKSIRENILDKDGIKDQNKEIQKILYFIKNKGGSIDSMIELLDKETANKQEHDTNK